MSKLCGSDIEVGNVVGDFDWIRYLIVDDGIDFDREASEVCA